MKFFYPAIITHLEDGSYTAEFPDLEMCTAKGDDLEDCLENAISAAHDWIQVELEEDDPQLPPSSDKDDLSLKENQMAREILINYRMTEGWEE